MQTIVLAAIHCSLMFIIPTITYAGSGIDGGVLQIDGSISSNTFVNHRGTLAGSGTVNGNVTNYGGTVSREMRWACKVC